MATAAADLLRIVDVMLYYSYHWLIIYIDDKEHE